METIDWAVLFVLVGILFTCVFTLWDRALCQLRSRRRLRELRLWVPAAPGAAVKAPRSDGQRRHYCNVAKDREAMKRE